MLKTTIVSIIITTASAAIAQTAQVTFPAGKSTSLDIRGFPKDDRIKITITPPLKSYKVLKQHAISAPKTPEPPQRVPEPAPTAGNFCIGDIYVQTEMPSHIPVETQKNIMQLTELNNGGKIHLASQTNGLGLGSTVAKQTVQLEWKKATHSQCMDAHVNIGYPSISIYIARELLKNECAYQHVLEHEKHHVDIYREALMQWQMNGPIEWKAPLEQALRNNEDPMPFFQQLLNEVKQRHQAFDSEEEYAKNEKACDKYIKRLIKRL
jgi:hypothetical protein